MEITQENIDLICRQTNYTQDEATQKLALHENDTIKVIKEYLEFTQKQQPELSQNQQFHTDIRNFLKTSYDQRPEQYKL